MQEREPSGEGVAIPSLCALLDGPKSGGPDRLCTRDADRPRSFWICLRARGRAGTCAAFINFYFKYDRYLFNNDMRRATTLPSLRTYIARYLYLLPSIRRDRTSHVTRSPALARFRYKVPLATQGFTSTSLYNH